MLISLILCHWVVDTWCCNYVRVTINTWQLIVQHFNTKTDIVGQTSFISMWAPTLHEHLSVCLCVYASKERCHAKFLEEHLNELSLLIGPHKSGSFLGPIRRPSSIKCPSRNFAWHLSFCPLRIRRHICTCHYITQYQVLRSYLSQVQVIGLMVSDCICEFSWWVQRINSLEDDSSECCHFIFLQLTSRPVGWDKVSSLLEDKGGWLYRISCDISAHLK